MKDKTKLKDEFESLLRDDPDFHYDKGEFKEWLKDYQIIKKMTDIQKAKCPQCTSKNIITLAGDGEPDKFFCLDCDYEDDKENFNRPEEPVTELWKEFNSQPKTKQIIILKKYAGYVMEYPDTHDNSNYPACFLEWWTSDYQSEYK